jgi:hypothetical protein
MSTDDIESDGLRCDVYMGGEGSEPLRETINSDLLVSCDQFSVTLETEEVHIRLDAEVARKLIFVLHREVLEHHREKVRFEEWTERLKDGREGQ